MSYLYDEIRLVNIILCPFPRHSLGIDFRFIFI